MRILIAILSRLTPTPESAFDRPLSPKHREQLVHRWDMDREPIEDPANWGFPNCTQKDLALSPKRTYLWRVRDEAR